MPSLIKRSVMSKLMSSSIFYFIIHATAFLYCLHFSIAGNNETDMLALLQIKHKITDDPLHVLDSWNHTLHFCEWFGVTCGRRHQRVTTLQLNSSKLTGFLSPFIGNLSFLRRLYLSNNNFGGTIPPQIGRLNRLQRLMLFRNNFEGQIPPNISACTNLVNLNIGENRLVGVIPSEFSFLKNLIFLTLERNNYLAGTIPPWLGNFTSLIGLYIEQNNFSGSIPESLSKLKSIKVLAFSQNKLSGQVPPSIFNLSSLESLDLGVNLLEGILPSNLGFTLPNLQWITIGTNNFTGTIPSSISNSSNLQILQFQTNKLHGRVPSLHKLVNLEALGLFENSFDGDLSFVSSLANATNMKLFGISMNNFTGMFPGVFCNFSMLTDLQLAGNNIAGQIPSCIYNLANLENFDASDNQLFGVISNALGKLKNLNSLDISNNQLRGVIPYTIGNLTKLGKFLVSTNKFEGQIPTSMGNCGNLISLDLSYNNFSSEIPKELFTLSTLSMYEIYLSNNHLSGSLPLEVGQLRNLVTLDVSENMLSGEIPSTLSACLGIEFLSMMGNSLQGTIPDALKSLKSLIELDLSQNNLSGNIPEFLASLPLQMLNLSYNIDLEGEIPKGGIFLNASGLLIVGNARLCGGMPELQLPKCSFNKHQKRIIGHKRRLILAVLFALLGVIFTVTLFVSLCCLWYRKRMKKPTSSDDPLANYPNLSYQTLLKATNGFASENLIGRGTFGEVYKGNLDDHDISIVAIKRFNLEQHGASKSFMAECGVLRNIRHRNLVKVMTVCSSTDYQGNDFKALVYEYMANGSLEDWLHPEAVDLGQNINDTSRSLNLGQRLDITVDVANALEYLHYHCGKSIVHCDLKPSNVLLDEEMVAHVSDFGLAKFLSKFINSSHTNQTSSSLGVLGTVGYTPPEYGVGNEVSTNGDVYSFGILVLEIFTGKKPTNDFIGNISLHHYVKEVLPERGIEIVDQALLHGLDGEEINRKNVLEGLVNILEIAIVCSAEVPQERLDMRDVSRKLSSIRNKLLGTQMSRRRRIQQGRP